MPDQQEFTAAQNARHTTPSMILTDIDNGYAFSLGLVLWVGDKLEES